MASMLTGRYAIRAGVPSKGAGSAACGEDDCLDPETKRLHHGIFANGILARTTRPRRIPAKQVIPSRTSQDRRIDGRDVMPMVLAESNRRTTRCIGLRAATSGAPREVETGDRRDQRRAEAPPRGGTGLERTILRAAKPFVSSEQTGGSRPATPSRAQRTGRGIFCRSSDPLPCR